MDLDDKEYILPVNGCVIRGCEGGGQPVFAEIFLHPRAIVPWLSAGPVVTEDERQVLEWFRVLIPAARKSLLFGKEKMLDDLVKRGFLARSKNGATKLTTLGKNASMKKE